MGVALRLTRGMTISAGAELPEIRLQHREALPPLHGNDDEEVRVRRGKSSGRMAMTRRR
jgi:hypothetical protein